jgi:S-adenosylmethionine:tRNA ribosyltransferase-isomerase
MVSAGMSWRSGTFADLRGDRGSFTHESLSKLLKSNSMILEEFDYVLPLELIAQRPLEQRDGSRMLVLDRASGAIHDDQFRALSSHLRSGDLVVFNNTKVFPARLLGHRRGITAQPIGKGNPAAREFLTAEIEVFLTHREGEDVWQALVHPGRKMRTGEIVTFGDGELEAEILGRGEFGLRQVRLRARDGAVDAWIERLGHVPLPPYIHRKDEVCDRQTYQTLYAKVRGAVAAPTAGLHFTEGIFQALREHGVETCEITLHVGLGTFQPVRVARVEDHEMELERYEIPAESAEQIQRALKEGRRVVAVGTTTVRTLEHVAKDNAGGIIPGRGETRLFITPGFKFWVISGLLTNFHLPKSTLLMLVSAFAGREHVLAAYRHAITQKYRFYSYGDCMLIL